MCIFYWILAHFGPFEAYIENIGYVVFYDKKLNVWFSLIHWNTYSLADDYSIRGSICWIFAHFCPTDPINWNAKPSGQTKCKLVRRLNAVLLTAIMMSSCHWVNHSYGLDVIILLCQMVTDVGDRFLFAAGIIATHWCLLKAFLCIINSMAPHNAQFHS